MAYTLLESSVNKLTNTTLVTLSDVVDNDLGRLY